MVDKWTDQLRNDLRAAIVKKKIGDTGNLSKNLRFKIVHAANGDPVKVIFDMEYYGRMVDMGVGKGVKLGDVKGNYALARANGLKGRRPKKWFSKTFYSDLNALQYKLKTAYGINAVNMVNEGLPYKLNLKM